MKFNKYKKLKIFSFTNQIKDFDKNINSSILIFGNFGAMNLGDESILAGEISEIKNMSDSVHIMVVSRYPAVVKKIHGKNLDVIPLKNPLKIISAVLKSKTIIVGGGGLFNKNRSGISGYIYQLYFMLLLLLFPKLIRKKVYLLGIGIYSNMNNYLFKIAIKLFKLVDLITVRDFHSYKLLKKNNIKCNLYKDNSYLMNLLNSPVKTNRILGSRYSKNKINIGLSLRTPFTKTETEYLVKAVASFILKNKTATFWFYVLDNHHGRQNDTIINRLVTNRVKKFNLDIRSVKNLQNPQLMFSTFRLMDKFITMRLHSMIFADRLDIPFVGISYDTKCSDFLESVGKKNLNIDVNLEKLLLKF